MKLNTGDVVPFDLLALNAVGVNESDLPAVTTTVTTNNHKQRWQRLPKQRAETASIERFAPCHDDPGCLHWLGYFGQ